MIELYPCGCSATGGDDLPNYCPEHGTPWGEPRRDALVEEATQRSLDVWKRTEAACAFLSQSEQGALAITAVMEAVRGEIYAVLQHLASQRQEQDADTADVIKTVTLSREVWKDTAEKFATRIAQLEDDFRAQAAAHAEDLQAARAIGESFFEALKPLNLQAINLIALVARLRWLTERLASDLDHATRTTPGEVMDAQGYNFILAEARKTLAELAPTTPTP